MRIGIAVSAILLAAACAAAAQAPPAQGMTQAQAAEIVRELHDIEALLRQMAPAGAPAARGAEPTAATAPSATPVSIALPAGTPALGKPAAVAAMVEFTDLECPNCREFHALTFPAIKTRYIDTGKLRFFSLDLPLSIHPYALPAAVAEHCAGEQGKFWEFRGNVLAITEPLTPKLLDGAAARAGLNAGVLTMCQAGHNYDSAIAADQLLAASAGIRGTPGFIVGRIAGDRISGTRVLGAQPFTVFREAIEAALAR